MWTLMLVFACAYGADDLTRIRDTAFANAAAITSIEFESTTRSQLKDARFPLSTHVKLIAEGNVSRTEITTLGSKEPRIFVFDGKRYFVFNRTTGKMEPEGRWDGLEVAVTFEPLKTPYMWLANPRDHFTWASIKNREVWDKRFEDASYKGTAKLPLGECDVVVLPGNRQGSFNTVHFLRDANSYPIRCESSHETGKMFQEVTQLDALDIEGTRCSFPKSIVLKFWDESGELKLESTIDTDRLVVNPVIDPEMFRVAEKQKSDP